MAFLLFIAIATLPFWITSVVMAFAYMAGAVLGAVGAMGKIYK